MKCMHNRSSLYNLHGLPHVSENGVPLGEWISSQMKAGRHFQIPVYFKSEDTDTQLCIKQLIYQMICPLAKDRLTSQEVCDTIKAISGTKYDFHGDISGIVL